MAMCLLISAESKSKTTLYVKPTQVDRILMFCLFFIILRLVSHSDVPFKFLTFYGSCMLLVSARINEPCCVVVWECQSKTICQDLMDSWTL